MRRARGWVRVTAAEPGRAEQSRYADAAETNTAAATRMRFFAALRSAILPALTRAYSRNKAIVDVDADVACGATQGPSETLQSTS